MTDNITPAKRGDLALFQQESSTTYLHGRTERTYSYLFAKVTSVTLQGLIKRAERYPDMEWPWSLGSGGKSWIVPREKLNGHSVDDLLPKVGERYPSMEAARDALRALIGTKE